MLTIDTDKGFGLRLRPETKTPEQTMAQDRFQAHDYYLMDELLTDEHKLIRDTARAWIKAEVSPKIGRAHV